MILIDTNNLWYAAMERAHPLAGISRSDFVTLLDRWARTVGDRVVLVLDGAGTDTPSPNNGADRVYSGSESADAVIRRWVADSSDPRSITVVSSDRSLVREVRKRRVRTQPADELADRLETWLHRPGRGGATEPAAKQAGLGGVGSHVDDWLNYFELHTPGAQSDIIVKDGTSGQAGGNDLSREGPESDHATEEDDVQRALRRAFGGAQPLKRRDTRDESRKGKE